MWDYKIWRVTKDSIFQEDDLSFAIGRDKCSYSLKNDTLTVRYWGQMGNRKMIEDKYVLIKSDKDSLQLLNIFDRMHLGEKIREDIQLR